MATTIVTKNSSTASAVPTAAQLVQGELAVNVADKRLYTEDNAGAIVELGTNPSTLTVTGEITANGGIALGDNDKATFGASDDLQIYHDGSNSYIKDAGTGDLVLNVNNFRIKNAADTEIYLFAQDGVGVKLFHTSNEAKLATTATGIDVTGTATMDGLVVDGNNNIQLNRDGASSAKIFWNRSGTTDAKVELEASENLVISVDDAGLTGKSLILKNNNKQGFVLSDGGDISFYEDTGTTAKLFWDASAESLGIGTSSSYATSKLTLLPTTNPITASSGDIQLSIGEASANPSYSLKVGYINSGGGYQGSIQAIAGGVASSLLLNADGGNVGIGTSSPASPLDIHVATDINMEVDSNASVLRISSVNDARTTNPAMSFQALSYDFRGAGGIGTRAIIDSSGNLLVGTTSTASNGPYRVTADGGVNYRPLACKYDSTGGATQIAFINPNGQVGGITTSGSSTSYNTSSDQRLKENIADADDAGSKIDAIQVRQYDWKADGSHQDYGMVAQELQLVAPEAVSGDADSEDMMGVDYSKLVPMLIKEIQSLRNRVAQLEA